MNQVAQIDTSNKSEISEMTDSDGGRSDVFIARQPIFDRNSNVHAYELLFRGCENNSAAVVCGNMASSQVLLNAFVNMNIQEISENRHVFVNFTREFLTGEITVPLSPNSLVVEILEDVEIDDEVMEGLRKLSAQGYLLALDDYVFTDDKEPLFDIINIVKVDLMGCDIDKMRPELEELKNRGIKLLAEKVETYAEFELCKELGFDYYQGFFFSKPMILTGQSIKPNRMAVLQIVSKLQDPNCDICELEDLISKDIGTSFKNLRIINSAFYNFQREIKSVREAIVALGLKTIRDWMSLIVLTDIDDKPRELINQSLRRARMMYSLSSKVGLAPEVGFMVGLFSSLDAIMDQPMEKILRQLPLSPEVEIALTEGEGDFGRLLEIVSDYERGNWQNMPVEKLSAQILVNTYVDSITWSNQLFSQLES